MSVPISLIPKLWVSSSLIHPFQWAPLMLFAGGGGLTAGVVGVELSQGYPISKALKSAGTSLASLLSPIFQPRISSSEGGFCTFLPWVCNIPSSIQRLFSTILTKLTSVFPFIFSQSVHQYSQASKFIEGLQSTFFKQQELKELFRDAHTKFPRLISFFTSSENRKKFTRLFYGESWNKTKEAFKVLSGSGLGANSIFKVEDGLLAHIMNKFLLEPGSTLDKVERISKLISSVSKPSESGVSSTDSTPEVVNPYLLSKERIDYFFKQRTDGAQDVYEDFMVLEIGLNSLGAPIPDKGTSLVSSILSSILGRLVK